ncbi:MAG: substrate-binding domain-containing protein, partial [Chloroflexi bacterium]|nr:substrate-binding domain-containing protein [Chloroflexota bacterium]
MVKRITIKDVAERANTSYQTVSRVINDKPDVSPETRKRVLKVIAELNYRPSMAATTRANPKTHIMAVAISLYNEYLLYEGDPHLLRMIHGVDDALEIRNYSLLLTTIHFTNNNAIESRLLNRQLADGVIIRLSMHDKGQTATLLKEKGYPVVVIGHSDDPNIPSIRSDDEHGGYTQTQHLIALGHRNIGIICGPESDPATAMRRKGHNRAMTDSGLDPTRTPHVGGGYTVEGGYEAAAQLMQEAPDLTAIIAFSDTMAIGAMRWLRKQGYDVPGDVSVVGYDDIPNARRQMTPLTTINIPSMEEGRRAVQVLFDLIENRKVP